MRTSFVVTEGTALCSVLVNSACKPVAGNWKVAHLGAISQFQNVLHNHSAKFEGAALGRHVVFKPPTARKLWEDMPTSHPRPAYQFICG